MKYTPASQDTDRPHVVVRLTYHSLSDGPVEYLTRHKADLLVSIPKTRGYCQSQKQTAQPDVEAGLGCCGQLTVTQFRSAERDDESQIQGTPSRQ